MFIRLSLAGLALPIPSATRPSRRLVRRLSPLLSACLFIVPLCLPSGVLAADALPGATVESLLELARAANYEVTAMRQEALAAEQRVAPATALPDPRIRVELQDITKEGTQNPTLLPNHTGSTRYQLMQDLPWFGKRELRGAVAALEARGAAGRAGAAWADVAARIKTDYAQLLYLHRNALLTGEIIGLARQVEQIAQVRYASGLGAQPDVLRAQLEQTNLSSELIALESEQRQVRARLNAMAARPVEAPLAAPEQLRPLPSPAMLDFKSLAARLHSNNPQLAAEMARAGAAEKSRELTYKNRYPDLTVGVAPIQRGGGIREWELMFELNIPLQQGTRRAQEREAEAMLAAARTRQQGMASELLADLSEQVAGLDAARRTATLIEGTLVPQAELGFKAALASYENGKVDFATLLDAQRQIRQARQNQIKAQAEAQLRLAQIERIVGEEL
jgi:outer membrane protein, heavy metal efflux system